jgi:hypothetical protein
MIDERGASGLSWQEGKKPASESRYTKYLTAKSQLVGRLFQDTRQVFGTWRGRDPTGARRISCQEKERVERLTKMEKTCKIEELGQ